MTTYGDQRDQKWTGSAIKPSVCLSRSGPEVSVCLSVRPKHFPYLLDEHHARELQAQGACALRFLHLEIGTRIFTFKNIQCNFWKMDWRLLKIGVFIAFLIPFLTEVAFIMKLFFWDTLPENCKKDTHS